MSWLMGSSADWWIEAQNIMDLIPPPMPIATSAMTATATSGMDTATSLTTSPADAATSTAVPMPASLSTPLGPPSDLMLRALSPPTSLLPDFVQPPAMELDGSLVKSETSATGPATTASASSTPTALGQAALLKKVWRFLFQC